MKNLPSGLTAPNSMAKSNNLLHKLLNITYLYPSYEYFFNYTLFTGTVIVFTKGLLILHQSSTVEKN